MKKGKILLGLIASAFVFSCNLPTSKISNSSTLTIGFHFPDKSPFTVNSIPTQTETIELQVLSETDEKDIVFYNFKKDDIDKNRNIVRTIKGLSDGKKIVQALALDKQKKLVSKAITKVTVAPDVSNKIVLDMEEVEKNVILTFNKFEDQAFQYIVHIVTTEGDHSFKTYTSKTLNLGKMSDGLLSASVTLLDKNYTTIAVGKYKLNVSDKNKVFNLDLEKFELPDTFDFSTSKAILDVGENLTFDLIRRFVPKSVTDVFDKSIIPFPDNKSPVIKEVIINGKPQSLGLVYSSIILKDTDSLNVEIKVEDPENDGVNFVWGIVSKNASGNSEMKLFKDQRGNKFSVSNPKVGAGIYYLVALIADNKSPFVSYPLPIISYDKKINFDLSTK